MITVAVVNRSTLVTAPDVLRACTGIQRQVTGDFAPCWGIDAVIADVQTAPPSTQTAPVLTIALVDHSDDAGALGYHAEDGTGIVAVADCIADDVPWSSCLSHEVLEALSDPEARRLEQSDDGDLWSLEVCDPVEGSDPTYTIDGVALENFVTPAFFGFRSGLFDFRKRLPARWTLAPNGYAMILRDGKWTQRTAAGCRAAKILASPSSRRARRMARTGHAPDELRIECV